MIFKKKPDSRSVSLFHLLVCALVSVPFLGGATCSGWREDSSRLKEQAVIHYDLGVQAMQNNDARGALVEYEKAVELDEKFDLAHNALGLIYQISFNQSDKAIFHYKRALEINPRLSEGYTNLGALYIDQGRFDEAIPLFDKALSDILYKTPYIAENNLGWCYFKKGSTQLGIDHIKSALISNPKFCLGHRNLGLIYSEIGQTQKATASFEQYAKHCPEVADARYRYGRALLASRETEAGRRELAACAEKGKGRSIGDDCQRLLEEFEK